MKNPRKHCISGVCDDFDPRSELAELRRTASGFEPVLPGLFYPNRIGTRKKPIMLLRNAEQS